MIFICFCFTARFSKGRIVKKINANIREGRPLPRSGIDKKKIHLFTEYTPYH